MSLSNQLITVILQLVLYAVEYTISPWGVGARVSPPHTHTHLYDAIFIYDVILDKAYT